MHLVCAQPKTKFACENSKENLWHIFNYILI